MTGTIGIMRVVGGALGRAAMLLGGLLTSAALVAPLSGPDAGVRPGSEGGGRRVQTVALTIPEGELSAYLTITDDAGRELATLTRWSNDEIVGVVPRGEGIIFSFWLGRDAGASLQVAGRVDQSEFRFRPDGTTESSVTRRTVLSPAGIP